MIPVAYLAIFASSLPLIPVGHVAYRVLPWKVADPLMAALMLPQSIAILAVLAADVLLSEDA